MKKILAAIATVIAIFSIPVVASSAAQASTTPVLYAAHADGWHGYVKPGTIQFFLNGGGPFITNITWKSWGTTSAWGTGKLWTQKPGCTPIASCRYYSRWIGLSMTNVTRHGTQPYYSRMAATFYISGQKVWQVGWLRYVYPGATQPMWLFPNKYPYL